MFISLRRAANGHICTLDSGESCPSTHRWSQCMHDARNSHHNMFQSGTDFWGGTWIRRTTPFREAWVLTPLMAFLIGYGPSAFTARLPAGVNGMMSIKGECLYPSVGVLMDTFVRWTPGEPWPSTHRWSQCMHGARNSYTQYVPIGYRLLGRYLDKAYNYVPGGVGSNPPHGISNTVTRPTSPMPT
jgi:hypothetical protein